MRGSFKTCVCVSEFSFVSSGKMWLMIRADANVYIKMFLNNRLFCCLVLSYPVKYDVYGFFFFNGPILSKIHFTCYVFFFFKQ